MKLSLEDWRLQDLEVGEKSFDMGLIILKEGFLS